MDSWSTFNIQWSCQRKNKLAYSGISEHYWRQTHKLADDIVSIGLTVLLQIPRVYVTKRLTTISFTRNSFLLSFSARWSSNMRWRAYQGIMHAFTCPEQKWWISAQALENEKSAQSLPYCLGWSLHRNCWSILLSWGGNSHIKRMHAIGFINGSKNGYRISNIRFIIY